MVMGNFLKEGLQEIRRKWGGESHTKMIQETNNHLHERIRCTSYCWHEIYEKCVAEDSLDITLI